MAPKPKPADYAAIGVAPVLIFLMISSLANYFLMLFYQGQYGDRGWYLIAMYTMGSVALARLVIEENRAYTAGYAILLGGAMLFVMTRFVGAPFFSLGIIVLIGYLSDRIVHDCTLIDEKVDASGEGLIDRGLDEASGIGRHTTDVGAPETEKAKRRKKSHQPGRTVFLLALAALPLFGLGQFVLSNDPLKWSRAQLMLGLYLFASLSLLVTTSFLNLRRYLRQRDVDMPLNVTFAWLIGGLSMVAALLLLAFLAPVPGSAIANFQLPEFLSTSETSASQFGWGGEGADKTENESDAETSRDQPPNGQQQKGAGQNQNESSGEMGGEKPSEQTNSSDSQEGSSSSESKSQSAQQGENGESGGSSGEQQSGDSNSSNSDDQGSSGGENKSQQEQQQGSQPGESGESSSSESDSSQSPSENQSRERPDSESPDGQSNPQEQSPNSDSDKADSERSEQQPPSETAEQQRQEQQRQDPSQQSMRGPMSELSNMLSSLGGLIRFLLILALVVIVAVYLYRMRDAIARWLKSLFERSEQPASEREPTIRKLITTPPKPFSAFRNPIGRETDPRRVVVITAQAFDAWMRERGFARGQDETPSAFVERLRVVGGGQSNARAIIAPVENHCVRLSVAYDRIVYGRGGASQRDLDAASALWQYMSNSGMTQSAG